MYLAGLKDLSSGELVGYAISERTTKQLVLFRAVASQRPAAGLIHHTDRGSQGGFSRSRAKQLSRRFVEPVRSRHRQGKRFGTA